MLASVMLLVPADPLRVRRPDEHFAREAAAASRAGVEVGVVDHDALTNGDGAQAAVARVPGGGEAVYRGWMVRSEEYAALAGALLERGVGLRTSPEQYRRAHELPGWYAALTAVTPRTVWTTGAGRDDFDRARAELGRGPAVLRDYTKSMKHYWHEAAYIPDLADAAPAWAVASRFRQLRDADFVGGYVLREFEPFTGAEARTWWVDGRHVLTTAHPDTPDATPPSDVDLTAVAPLVAELGLPFVTVDMADRGGWWRVVELGDGQVSDLPAGTDPAALIGALFPDAPMR